MRRIGLHLDGPNPLAGLTRAARTGAPTCFMTHRSNLQALTGQQPHQRFQFGHTLRQILERLTSRLRQPPVLQNAVIAARAHHAAWKSGVT